MEKEKFEREKAMKIKKAEQDATIKNMSAMAEYKKKLAAMQKLSLDEQQKITDETVAEDKRLAKKEALIQRMKEVFSDYADTKDFVHKLLINKCGDKFKAELKTIYPIKNACIRKVKLIKRPNKEDLRRIDAMHKADVQENVEMS